MDLEIRSQRAEVGGQESVQALVTVYCRPQKTYLLLASTNFLDWIPVATNTPTGSRFDYLDTLGSAGGPPAPFGGSPNGISNALNGSPGESPGAAGQRPALPQRFFRAVMLEHLYDGLGLSMQGVGPGGTRPYHARLTVAGAQPNHTLILQASADLRHWTSLATNTPAIIINWPFLDTNAPSFDRRFYRVRGVGK